MKTTNILAPFIQTDSGYQFYVAGRMFEMNNNVITEIESAPGLSQSIAAFESFEFLNDSVRWFNGSSKFVYNLEENAFYYNDTVIEGNFTEYVLASGLVRYENKSKAELFESISKLVENFIVLDFAAGFEGNSNIINVFKIEERVFVSRFNTTNRISKFFESNANDALAYVTEQTGQDATSFLSELLEGEAKEIAEKQSTISKYEDMIAFLKDQRGLLAEADKSIEEIKAADILISEEISNWESKIAELTA